MKTILSILLALGSVSTFANEITCGEVSKFKAISDDLEIQITIKRPSLTENVDPAAWVSKGIKKETISIRFNRLEDYAIHSLAEDGMIKGIQMMFKTAFVCHTPDSLRLGVERSRELALADLLEHL